MRDALEGVKFSHGEFTQALLDGLRGDADENPKDQRLRFDELGSFVKRKVLDSTEGEQEPDFFKPPGMPSFDVVRY